MIRSILRGGRTKHLRRNLKDNNHVSNYAETLGRIRTLEEQLEQRTKQLESAKESFLKNIYHEIRTPLNAIVGFSNLIAGGFNGKQDSKKRYLELINKSSNDFLKTMDDIIQASLLEAGMISLCANSWGLGSFLDEAYAYANLRKHILGKTNVLIVKKLPEKYSDVKFVCDKRYLNQVLNQLLENALKYTNEGVVEFGVEIKGKQIEFYITDSGIGIEEGMESEVFGKFSKTEIVENTANGLGLGLANCKHLINLMDGNIWYSSVIGEGTSFKFSIPFITTVEEPFPTKSEKITNNLKIVTPIEEKSLVE